MGVVDTLNTCAEVCVKDWSVGAVTICLCDVGAGCDFAVACGLVAALARRTRVGVALNGGAFCGTFHTLEVVVWIAVLVFATGDVITGCDLFFNTCVDGVIAEVACGTLALIAFTLVCVGVAALVGETGCVGAAARFAEV